MKPNRLLIQLNATGTGNIKQDQIDSFFCKKEKRALEIVKSYPKGIFKRAFFRDKDGVFYKMTQKGIIAKKDSPLQLTSKEFNFVY